MTIIFFTSSLLFKLIYASQQHMEIIPQQNFVSTNNREYTLLIFSWTLDTIIIIIIVEMLSRTIGPRDAVAPAWARHCKLGKRRGYGGALFGNCLGTLRQSCKLDATIMKGLTSDLMTLAPELSFINLVIERIKCGNQTVIQNNYICIAYLQSYCNNPNYLSDLLPLTRVCSIHAKYIIIHQDIYNS